MKFNTTYTLIFLVFIWGCSTNKNTNLSRAYHNLAAHYNVYFNGNQSFKEGVEAIEEANQDDYTQLLAVFPESKPGSQSVASSQMDRAIEKGAKLIKKHSIRKKPEKKRDDQSLKYKKFLSQNEYNKWVDNAYLLIGKAHYYKHEYYLAQQSFAYMFREFQTGPEWYEAEIWNARCAIELGDFAEAKILLENYDIEGKAPSKLFGLFAATYADFYIRQGMYAEAIPFLKEAIEGAKSKYYYRRYNFILAQLYQKRKQYAHASRSYLAVIKSNPPYEMAFNAKVNRAGVLFEEGGLDAVKKEIKKLLRDKRNLEYEDQIYYALALAYKAENEEDLAMENLLRSIEKSTDNKHQKGMSFYQLSEIYYERPQYKPAYYYLDTAMVNLNENFRGLDTIKTRHENLARLVKNINMVEREDSLIAIMAMPEAQRYAFIDGLIEKEKERLEALKKAEQEDAGGNLFYDPLFSQSQSTPSQGGKWYFYNQASVGMGKLEFEKRWGRRNLEDNWRRSNKEIIVEQPDFANMGDPFPDQDPFGQDSIPGNELLTAQLPRTQGKDPLKRESYLKDLPSTPKLMLEAQQRIQEGLLNQGLIYKEEINNLPYAIDAFEQLVSRFPDGPYLEDALMNLYLGYELQNDVAAMNRVKSKLMDKFPDGEFTAYLNDPQYAQKREARNKKIETLYQESYSAYLFNDFATPIANLQQALQVHKESSLIPKFKFLAGLSRAKTGDALQFEMELKDITQNYPNSEITPLAAEMLKLYAEGRTPVKGPVSSNLIAQRTQEFTQEQRKLRGAQLADTTASSYMVDNKAQHALIVLLNTGVDLNRLRFNIADYNFSKFLLNDYEMDQTQLPDETIVLRVSGFNNRLEALDYFYSLRERNDIFKVDNLEYQQMYVINGHNMEYLLSSGDKERYDSFFIENYLSAEAFKNLEEERRREQSEALKAQNKTLEAEVPALTKALNESATKQETQETQELPQEIAPSKTEESSATIEKAKLETAISESPIAESPITETVITETPVIEKPTSIFTMQEGRHDAMILFKKGHIDTKRIGTIFTNYTKSNYGAKYEVEHNTLREDYYYIKAKGFSNANEADAFLKKVKLNSFLMREIARTKNYLLPITNDNFLRLSDEESFGQYQEFYKSNY
ncbi:hypothetical protein SAMN06265379_10545 [Saccharicrinis carchari]|uniref:Uncharacterized protein n=1 Tax=Saccharicrinis carchari TaxID=1168039 RepID=A0A521DCA7_SACCC|nr:hypothetical protein [Saccharicrinis carchari]SMO69228.1 hypothetical protein SAMN06265379_10545 [Saccharicrinis carchari]